MNTIKLYFKCVLIVCLIVRFVLLLVTVLLVIVVSNMIHSHNLVKWSAWMAVIAVLLLLIVIYVLLDGHLIVQIRTVKK